MYWCDSLKFFDLHCDTAYECFTNKQEFTNNTLAVSAVKGAVFDEWHQTFAVWIKDDTENPFRLYKSILGDCKEKIRNKPKNLTPYFSLEGGAAIENTDCIYEMKSDGIKFITLTWNGENRIAGGCKTEKVLTDYGKQVIKVMNRLKIACDLSHLNEKSFYSAIEESDYPLATHSDCKAVCNNQRNLTDNQIRLICEKGGIIGLCPYPEFLQGELVEKMYENIKHLCDMGYENNISIGTDFDGAVQDTRLKDISKIPDFFSALESKGLKKELLYKIFYKNAVDFIAKLK